MKLRYSTAGESHGPELTAIVEGVPAGLKLLVDAVNRELARRQLGYGRGGRMKIEKDAAVITGGVRHGITLGSPISLRIENADWKNWRQAMATGETGAKSEKREVTVPRPGHADLAGMQKYCHADMRNVLERASARETAARVAVGAIARVLLSDFDISVVSHVISIGKAAWQPGRVLELDDFSAVDRSPVRCIDGESTEAMKQQIDSAREQGESVGGIFEVRVFGLVPGLGSYVTGPQRLGGRIGGMLMSIPAIKGVEIGAGFSLAAMPGSAAHDEIFFEKSRGFFRNTNAAGGLEGGMTNGETLVARACMKPIPTLTSPLHSVDVRDGREVPAHKERSDVCAVPAAAVVGEAMVAIELAGALLDKFGGDCMTDMREAFLAYLRRLRGSWPQR